MSRSEPLANIKFLSEKIDKHNKRAMQAALTRVFETTPVVPGIEQGRARQRGTIPYGRTKRLSESLKSSNTRRSLYGSESWRTIIRWLQPGDTASFTWQAPYVNYVHFGANGVPGTYWVTIMGQKLPWELDAAFRRAEKDA